MLGDNIATVRWPACGEIDIMENVGYEPSIVHGSMHGPGASGGHALTGIYTLPGVQKFSDSYHIFTVEWEPNVARFYVDGNLYETRTPTDLPAGASWVYDHPFFVLLNVAVGGKWPGNPDQSTVFPQTMLVDYVRVYARKE
jgi:beta-glucanase (GH16 family)